MSLISCFDKFLETKLWGGALVQISDCPLERLHQFILPKVFECSLSQILPWACSYFSFTLQTSKENPMLQPVLVPSSAQGKESFLMSCSSFSLPCPQIGPGQSSLWWSHSSPPRPCVVWVGCLLSLLNTAGRAELPWQTVINMPMSIWQ